MLVELCIGDAYGSPFEYSSPEFCSKFNDGKTYVPHRRGLGRGHYTDDGQMSIGIAELLLCNSDWTKDNIAQKFVEVFKRDERKGYSSGFYSLLKQVNNGQELLAKINPDSERSGAAMRVTPVGLFKNTREVIERAKVQATITHNTPLGISAAIASAMMTHFFARNLGRKSELGFFLEFYAEDNIAWDTPYTEKVGQKGWMSVLAAITAIKASFTMTDLLKRCIAFTGDVDTVAAIALAAASFSPEIEQDLPQSLYAEMENGTYGKEYIQALDNQLMDRFGIKPQKRAVSSLLKKFDALTVKTRKQC